MTPTPKATEAHSHHLETLTAMPRASAQVEQYIQEVHRTEGPFYAKWLRDDYAKWRLTGKAPA